MSKTVLARGLLPLSQNSNAPSPKFQAEWLWVALNYHAHQFGGRPIGEVFVSWTTILLMDRGVRPTIGEIAKATGMARSTVSRYVDHQMSRGWIEERVDKTNRRRRELYLSDTGIRQLEKIVEFFHDMFREMTTGAFANRESSRGADLIQRLARMTARVKVEPDPE